MQPHGSHSRTHLRQQVANHIEYHTFFQVLLVENRNGTGNQSGAQLGGPLPGQRRTCDRPVPTDEHRALPNIGFSRRRDR